jgi:molybdopterin converting factor small subunit
MADSITVQVRYLADLQVRTGRRQEGVILPADSRLQDALDWLNSRYGLTLPEGQAVMVVLNGRGWSQLPDKTATRLNEGDQLLLLPPISGG